jgi:hypothetical protein
MLIVALLVAVFSLRVQSTPEHSPFLPHFMFLHEKDWIAVQGTWRLDAGGDAYPSQTTMIECSYTTMQCIEASAVLLQAVSIIRLKILRWDNDLIVAEGTVAQCVDALYEFRPITNAVTGVQKRTCSPGEVLTKIHMVDGYEESWAKRRFRRPPGK